MKNIVMPFDSIGIVAGILCGIHCLATPFIFIAKACSATCCSEAPTWWTTIDYIFLLISFIAIYFITKNSKLNWLKYSFWVSWIALFIIIANHSLKIFSTADYLIYIPASMIIILHFYNMQFCKCQDKTCCPS